jgi:hypothetical protein
MREINELANYVDDEAYIIGCFLVGDGNLAFDEELINFVTVWLALFLLPRLKRALLGLCYLLFHFLNIKN